MSIAGILVAAYVFYLFATNLSRAETLLLRLFTVNLLYEGFINVGVFLNLGSTIFKVADFMQFVCVFISLILLVKKGFKLGLIAFLAAIGMSVLMLVINPLDMLVRTFNGIDFVNNYEYMHIPSFDLQTVKTSVRLICFAINATAVAACMTRERWLKILDLYLKTGRILIVYVWIEFVLKNILNITVTEIVIDFIFGADTSLMSSLERNGLFVVVGLNGEPSQFCMMLYSYFLIYLMSRGYRRQTKKQIALTVSGIALMVLCGSFRAVGLLPILLVLYLIQSRKPKQALIVACGLGVVAAVLFATGLMDYYLSRLERAMLFTETLDAEIGGGEAGRLNTIVEAFQVFAKRPLLGIGPGQTFAYGFIPSILAMTGVVGAIAWYVLMFGTVGRIGSSRYKLRWLLMALVISVSWIYTDSIAIGYSIYVIPMMLSIRYDQESKTVLPCSPAVGENDAQGNQLGVKGCA